MRLTADKAFGIVASKDPSKAVDTILEAVKAAAEKGLYSIRVREYGFGSNVCYAAERDWPKINKAIVKELRDLGFQCYSGSEARQFIDLWLYVSWSRT